MKKVVRRKIKPSKHVTVKKGKCPKCGGKMEAGVCRSCGYSAKTAYKSRREAKEFTYAAD